MMTGHTKRALDAAVDELKRNGYMVLVVLIDTKESGCICDGPFPRASCETHGTKRSPVTVLSSETNDPMVLAELMRTTLETVIHPLPPQRAN
jgi:hypothetical protein